MSKKKPVPPYLVATDQQIDLSYFDRLPDVASPEPVQKRKTGIMARMGDAGVSLLKGAIAVPEAAVGIADIATGGRVGKFLENEGGAVGFRPKQAREILDDQYSDAQKEANAKVQQAEGVADITMAALSNPSTIVHTGLEAVPSMLGGGVVARGLTRMAPKVPGLVAGAAGEGVVAAGSSAEQIRQQTEDGLLTPQQALIAGGSGATTGLLGVVGAKVAKSLGIADVDTMLAGAATNPAAQKNVVRRVLEGAVAEGVLEELPQSVQEQVAQNLALDRPLDEGVAYSAVMGTLAGGSLGGLANIPKPGPMARAAMAGAPSPVSPMSPGPIDFENVPIQPPKPEMSLGERDGMPFEEDLRFKQAPIYPNGRAPNRDLYGTPEAANIALGEQGLMESHRVVQTRPGVFEIRPKTRMSPVSPDVPNVSPGTGGDMGTEPIQADEPAPITPVQTLTPEQRRAGVDPLTGEVPPPPPFAPVPPAPDATEPGMVKGPDGTLRATFDTEQEARDHIAAGRKADRNIAISHQPVQLPDGRWTLALPGEPGHKGKKIKARMDGAGIPGQDATLLDPNTAKPWRTKQAASKFAKTVDGYEVLQNPDGGWILQQKVKGAAPEAKPGMSVSQEAPKDAAPTPIEFSAEDRSRIEGLFADGKNGAQVAKALGRAEPHADVVRAVGALRKELGIPGVSDAEAFKAWRDGRKTVDAAAHEAAPSPQNDLTEPTDGQKEAGNYKKGHTTISGLDLSIENPQGSVRRGKDRDGKEWENTLQHHYGYIKGTIGNDKDHVDAFVKPGTAQDYAGPVFVVDQVHPDTGKFDEHKALIGFDTEDEARKAYASNYAKGWAGLKSITSMPFAEFKTWVKDGPKTKPLAKTRDDAIEEAAGAASKTLQDGGTEADAMRAATTALIDQMGQTPEISISQDAPKAVDKATSKPPKQDDFADIDTQAILKRLESPDQSAITLGRILNEVEQQTGKPITESRADLSQPKTETEPAPSIGGAPASPAEAPTEAQAKWNAATQDERFETLKAAGWGFGKAGPSASAKQTAAKAWDKLTDSQRERIGAAKSKTLQGEMDRSGWTAEVDSPENTIWTMRKKGERYTARLLDGDRMEVLALTDGVDTAISMIATKDPSEAAQKASAAVAEDLKSMEAPKRDDKPDVAATARAPADAGTEPTPDARASEPSVGSGTDDTRGAVDSGAGQPVASAADTAPAGGGGDGAQAVAKAQPKPGDTIIGRRRDGVMIRADERGVRWYADRGARIFETVSLRPTRSGLVVDREILKPEFMTAEEMDKAAARAPAPNPEPQAAEPAVSANTVFTEDAAQRARQRLLSKLKGSQLNSGIDPEVIQDGITLAGYHIEKGARTFAAYAKAMLADLGDIAKPHLKSWYMGVKYHPAAAAWTDMDSAATVEAADIEAMGDVAQPAEAAQTPATEEPTNDPTPTSDAPAINQPMAEGLAAKDTPIRGSRPPRKRAGRADGGGVRASRGLFEGLDDEGGNLGDGRGDADVSNRPPEPVESGSSGLSARDFRPAVGGLTREGSWFDTAKRNIDLIDLALTIQKEGRPATVEEQAQLSKYVGFGASQIRNELFPVPSGYLKQQEPDRLIWPNLTRDARWKALAERVDALPREWQKSVLQSTQYAHYTSEGIIRSIWSGAQRMGFTGGKVLEPGMGIGSFNMLMPESVHKSTKYTGVEFDGPTALIAKLLSPQQNMLHDDFIKRKFPRDFFDLAIGNPPFSQTAILGDPDYEKYGFMLHDFFFAKSLDRVRPGGLLVFVTSKGTMDKQTDKARKYLAERADLMGAIRLPSTAFEANAGTSVVTDIIFLRKRAKGEAPAGHAWTSIKTIETKDGPTAVNEYFAANPDMVLGQQRISGNVDDEGRRINSNGRGGEKYTVVSYDKTPAELDAKVAAAMERLPENVYSPMTASSSTLRAETAKVDFDPQIKREGVVYVSQDGSLMRVESGVGRQLSEGVKLSEKDAAWFKSYVGLRDAVQDARMTQVQDGNWPKALRELNAKYDKFVADHGPVNDFRVQIRKSTDEDGNTVETPIRIYKNRRLLREDYDSSVVTQLEVITEAGEIVKAPFLLGRTIGKPVTREVKTIGDALAVSLDETGRLDIDDVARRIGLSKDDALEALGTQVFKTPQGEMQLADEYLSGDVVAKLDEATEAARLNSEFKRNVEALKEVQPEKLGPSQISVKLGASWVPARYITEFAKEIEAGHVTFDPKTESWQVDGGNLRSQRRAGAEYGTADRSASELLEAALNSRPVTVRKRDADKKEVTDQAATTAANEAIRKIKDKFKSWVWTDSERASELVESYNRRFNNIAPRRFDGSHLTLPGVSLRFKLHPHQLRAIWRQVQTGNTYLAHAVGAGKTIEMIAGGMEQRRLGLIKKPMYVVPNHMLEQFANEFMELYPLANIMVADDENFSADRRKAFVAAATLNAPDAIVITHSAFERIGVKEESVGPIRDDIISDLEIELDDVGSDNRVRRSQLQQQIEAVTQRFESIIGAGKKDQTIKFEDIGADYVFVDEAHTYRKLDFSTNQQIKGIDPNGSRRALDMYVKTRWLERQRPGRSMTFASGTPVTNTMGELYTIMRFFAQEELDRAGIATFDGWSRQFGEAVSALEANAAGKYEVVERFAKFDNVPELMSRVRQFMDVLTSESLGSLVKRPNIKGGKPNLVTVEATPELKDYMKKVLVPRLEKSRKWKPSKDEPFNPDPVIAITSDGRFAALDPRFFGADVSEDTPTKMNAMADSIAEEYKATAKLPFYADKNREKAEPIKGGTQIVFYNLGFGVQSQKNRGFNARAALTKRLVDKGVQRDHILWFDDADTDAKKEAMFKAMRSGQARVLIGSAKKMGTGVNVQKRLTKLHYFDPPWFPSDVEQPHGRIIRQGNQNEEVGINWYATKGTYDSTMWQMVGRKQRFIDQAFTGDKSLRSMDDMSEASVFEQAAAVASGDPRALQLAGLRQDVERMERLQAAHASEQINVRQALRAAEWGVDSAKNRIKTFGEAFKVIGERYFAFTKGVIENVTYDKLGEFGQAVKDAFNKKAADRALNPSDKPIGLGVLGDLPVRMHPDFDIKDKPTGVFELVVHVGQHQISVIDAPALGADVDAVGLARRLVNSVNGIEAKLREAKSELTKNETDGTRLKKKLGAPFEYQQELAEKYGDLKRLEEELKAEGEAPAPVVVKEDGSIEGEPPAFSRGAGAGMQPEALREAVAKLTKNWSNAPEVVVVSSMTDPAIPAAVRDENQRQLSQGATGEPEGFFYGGKAYLVASQIGTEQDARRVLFHETLGHYGLRGMFGEDLKGILGQIIAARPREVRAKVLEYGLSWNSKADRLIAAEEVLAQMAQDTPELGFVRRALAAIRTWLRGVGLRLGLSDAEIIRDFILPARQFVTGRRAGAGGGVAFSRDTNSTMPQNRGSEESAIAAGFTMKAYRGVSASQPFNDTGTTWLTTSKEVAEAYAEEVMGYEDPAVLEVMIKPDGLPRHDASKLTDEQREAMGADEFGNPQAVGIYDRSDDHPLGGSRRNVTVIHAPKNAVWMVDDGPMFSRSTQRAAETLKAFDVKQAMKATGNTLAHYRGMAMQALGRRQIVELWGKDLPQLVSYSEHVQRMEAEKNDTAAEADAIADAWGKLKDETKLAELMHDATVAQIDPAKPYQLVDSRADYDRLRKAWDALSPEAQGIYLKARDSYAAHYQAVKDAITDRVMRTMMAGDKRRVLLERMERDFFKSTKGVYFPLARFGKYVVVVRGKDGAAVAVSRAETINEAQEARARLVAEFPAAKGYTVGKILKDKEFNAAKDGPGKGFMDDLFEVLEGSNASNELIDSVGQLYLASLPDLSWAKHGIHRKGTPGFSQDARRAFAENVFHGARYLARLRWADRLQDDLVGMQEHVQANTETPEFDSIKAQQVVDEMVKRHDILMNPNSNPVSTALTSIGFVFHLGLSPASAMVNLLQTATTAYPVMGAKWGFDKSAAALMTASREAVKGGNDISKGLSGDELAAYNEAVKTGVIDVTMAHDLAGIAQGEDAKVSWALRPVMKAASFMFHHAEKFNRQVTFMAAYRLARAAGADAQAAYTQAVDATYTGHFDYSSTNRPRFMQGNVAKVVLLFKQYAQNMIYLLARQAHQSLKGLTPQERTEARKALAGVLVTHASVAGFLGLPLVGTLLSVASWLGSDDDEPWDAEAALRNSLADTFGTQAADIMAKGLSRATPWDISGRVGLNTLIMPDMQEGLEGKDLWKATLEAAAGPVAAIGGGILEGLKLFGEGEYTRGAEAMLPAALRGPVKALRYGTEGAQDRTGVSIVDEVSAAGIAGQALGLSPSEVRLATEAKSKVLSADKALMKRRSTLLSMAAKAAMAQDLEGLAEIREQIKGWNERNPSRAISSQHIRASVAARRRRIANAEGGVSLPQNRRGVIEAGAFGRQEAESTP